MRKTSFIVNAGSRVGRAALCLVALLLSLTSCSESDGTENEFDNWKERNDSFFNSIYNQAKSAVDSGSKEWKVIRQWSLPEAVGTNPENHIVARVLSEGQGSGCPLYTDTVYVHYRLRYIPTTQHPQGPVIEETWAGEYNLATMSPRKISVAAISGWETALQNMHIGDRWLLYVPYQLAYGTADYQPSSSSGKIYGCSVLIYDVTLVAYYRKGQVVPAWKSKHSDVWTTD